MNENELSLVLIILGHAYLQTTLTLTNAS